MKTLNHIQFLRAVSVLLVFLYHLQIDIFKNGYLGVDIFFVISGYVITSRIYLEYIKDNSFSFLNFYLKRFKRIFPALIFILSITLVIILIFQPVDLIVGNIIVYTFTIFGFSNIYYLYSNKDYFDNIFILGEILFKSIIKLYKNDTSISKKAFSRLKTLSTLRFNYYRNQSKPVEILVSFL